MRKTGFWPVVFGGVVAAALGSAATIYALPHVPPAWLPASLQGTPEPQVDRDAILAEAVAAAQASAQQIVDDFAVSYEPPAPSDATGGGVSPEDLTALAQELADLRSRLDDQAAQLAELQNAPAPGEGIDPEAAERLVGTAEEARQIEERIAARAEELEQRVMQAADEARQQLDTVQAEAQRLQAAAADSIRRAEMVAALASLQGAFERGLTAEEAQQALDRAGIAPPTALQQDVPSLSSLQADFDAAARAALRVSLREDSAAGGNVISNFLRAQTGARSTIPREGNDPDAILSRADAAVEAGRIDVALDELAALPEAARAEPTMAAWLSAAGVYRDAQAALADLTVPTE